MINKYSALLLIGFLTACSTAQESGTIIAAEDTDIREITHTYQGKTYPLELKWDGILKAYIVYTKPGAAIEWTSAEADDIRFQNMVRSAFRAQVCEPGLHPGILQFGYSYSEEYGYIARVKCTDKFQADA